MGSRAKYTALIIDVEWRWYEPQVESQKRFGLTAESLRVNAKFPTTFTNHAMQVPQLLFLKVSNDIQLEADLVLVLAP